MPQQKRKTVFVIGGAVLLVLVLTMLTVKYAHTAHLKSLQGTWEGSMHFHGGRLMRTQRIVLKIFEDNGSYHAAFDEIDMGRKNMPATQFDVGWKSVSFASGSGSSYLGRLNSDGTEIIGRWKWPGGRFSQPLSLTRTDTPDKVQEPLAETDYTPRSGSDLQGLWKGTLKFGKSALRLHLKITEPADGTFHAELNSIDQPPIIPMPATTLTYQRPSVKLSFQGIGAAFEGALDDSGSQIKGTWTQGPPMPLTFDRVNPKDEDAALEAGKNYQSTNDTDLQGHWTGKLSGRYGLHLRLVFNIAQLSDGSFAATLDSPDQSLFAMPFDPVAFAPPKVRLEIKSAGCTFDGELSGGKLAGTWSLKNVTSEPLTLERKS